MYVFIVATRKRKAPAKSDRLVDGLVSQFATSQKESTSMYIAAEERQYKLLADIEERKVQRDMAFRAEERAYREEDRAAERKHQERMIQMMLMMNQTQSQQFPNAHMNMHSPTHTGLTHLTMLHTPSTSQSHSSPNGSFFNEY